MRSQFHLKRFIPNADEHFPVKLGVADNPPLSDAAFSHLELWLDKSDYLSAVAEQPANRPKNFHNGNE